MKSNTVRNTFVGIGAGVVVVGLPFALWGFGVLWSGTHGTGELHKQNQNATNRVAAAGTWQASYNDVQRDIANLATVRSTYKNNDPQGFIVTAQTVCNQDVVHYNGLQTQPLLKDWKPDTLPASFDTDTCK